MYIRSSLLSLYEHRPSIIVIVSKIIIFFVQHEETLHAYTIRHIKVYEKEPVIM
jgi:hypothetical protein